LESNIDEIERLRLESTVDDLSSRVDDLESNLDDVKYDLERHDHDDLESRINECEDALVKIIKEKKDGQ